jgi:hypothetical protein
VSNFDTFFMCVGFCVSYLLVSVCDGAGSLMHCVVNNVYCVCCSCVIVMWVCCVCTVQIVCVCVLQFFACDNVIVLWYVEWGICCIALFVIHDEVLCLA